MRYASVAEVKNRLSSFLARAKRTKEPIVVTHYGKPYALIQPLSERDLEDLGWKRLGEARLREAWGGKTMPSTTTFRRGQVVVLDVPFSDSSGTKPRPAIVVSADEFHRNLPDVIVCQISSQPRYYSRPGPIDCPLLGWKAVGLRHPSTLRVSKVLAIDKQIIRRPLGTASQQDLTRIDTALRHALALPNTADRTRARTSK